MNIAILSREPNNYSTRRLVEVARARGHQVEVLDTLRCYMNIASHSPSIHYEGREREMATELLRAMVFIISN